MGILDAITNSMFSLIERAANVDEANPTTWATTAKKDFIHPVTKNNPPTTDNPATFFDKIAEVVGSASLDVNAVYLSLAGGPYQDSTFVPGVKGEEGAYYLKMEFVRLMEDGNIFSKHNLVGRPYDIYMVWAEDSSSTDLAIPFKLVKVAIAQSLTII